jgi:hypothetical protein
LTAPPVSRDRGGGDGGLRYVLLGCEARLSRAVLAELGPWLVPSAVVLAGFDSRPAPTLGIRRAAPPIAVAAPPGGLAEAAHRLGVPVLAVGSAGLEAVRAAVAALVPDLLLIACFPHVLDRRWLRLPRLGVLNVHPSLLPAYRGPSPLYWQRRHAEARTGVTVHWATTEVDAGPIVAQASFPLARSVPDDAVVDAQARAAGALLRVVLGHLRGGQGAERVPRGRAQGAIGASRFGWPPAT